MKPKRVIVWGHKLHSHTHSYIHSSYVRAFMALGFETHWLDSNDSIGSTSLDGTLFFSEDQAKAGMPVRDDCYYVTHHFNEEFLSRLPQSRTLKLCNYVVDAKKQERIGELCYFDSKSRSLYQPWATDLLPKEIDEVPPRKFNINEKDCYYIGSIYDENYPHAENLARSCHASGINLSHVRSVTDKINMELTRKSIIVADLRGNHHCEVGYIPCRVFKAISYGTPVIVNSRKIAEELPLPAIGVSERTVETLMRGIHHESSLSNSSLIESMNHIRNNHTFVNRVQRILEMM